MTGTTVKKREFVRALFSRMLHLYFLMRRGLTIGVRAIVRSDDGRFLLVRHTYIPGWFFPGGGVEKGQTIEQALSEELLQETSLKLTEKPVMYGIFHNKGVNTRDHIIVLLCKVQGEVEVKSTSMEIAEIGYFNPNDLPADTDPGTVRRIKEVVWGGEKTENW